MGCHFTKSPLYTDFPRIRACPAVYLGKVCNAANVPCVACVACRRARDNRGHPTPVYRVTMGVLGDARLAIPRIHRSIGTRIKLKEDCSSRVGQCYTIFKYKPTIRDAVQVHIKANVESEQYPSRDCRSDSSSIGRRRSPLNRSINKSMATRHAMHVRRCACGAQSKDAGSRFEAMEDRTHPLSVSRKRPMRLSLGCIRDCLRQTCIYSFSHTVIA